MLLACQVSHVAPDRPECPCAVAGPAAARASSVQLVHLVRNVPGTPCDCGSVSRLQNLVAAPGGATSRRCGGRPGLRSQVPTQPTAAALTGTSMWRRRRSTTSTPAASLRATGGSQMAPAQRSSRRTPLEGHHRSHLCVDNISSTTSSDHLCTDNILLNDQTKLWSGCLGEIELECGDCASNAPQNGQKHIKSAEKIKQSKGLARNQTIKIPQIPLSHPTGFQNQNNQNPGKIPGNGEHCFALWHGRLHTSP